jgi:hypothetical protein
VRCITILVARKSQLNAYDVTDPITTMFRETIILLFCLLDILYLLRAAVTCLLSYVRQPVPGTHTLVTHDVCWPTDIDPFLHMNNSKYLRKMDYGRYDFFVRSGIIKPFRRRNIHSVVTACVIQYRREVRVLTLLKIETKIVWVDEKSIYFQ